MLCEPAAQTRINRQLSSQIDCRVMVYDDAWLRDSGPSFVFKDNRELQAIGWNFNGWGDKFSPWGHDRTLAERIAESLNVPFISADIIAEGGALHSDGQGYLLTTEQCLLNVNRNPGADKAFIESELGRLTGAEQIVWLGEGLQDDHTDGHIDELACFASPGVILLSGCENSGDANYPLINDARQRLCAVSDSQGKKFDIIELPQPEQQHNSDDQRLTLSYVNFYLCNGALIMPSFEQPQNDANARAILAEQFPGRVIYQQPALPIVAGGGGIHCITQQQPQEVVTT